MKKVDIQNIDNIELIFLTNEDYEELKDIMIEAYASMPNSYWNEHHIKTLIKNFPEGQVAIKVDNELAGCALSIIVDYSIYDNKHRSEEHTSELQSRPHLVCRL